MNKHSGRHWLHAKIDAKLADIARDASSPPTWYPAWASLGAKSNNDERLPVYRAVRDSGLIPPDAGFFLVAWILDLLTDHRAQESLRELEAHLEAVRQKHGIDPDALSRQGDLPAEYVQAMEQMYEAWNALYASTMEQSGEREMARLFREAQDEFDERYEGGRQFFHGSDGDVDAATDAWLDAVLETVTGCVEAFSPMGPLGLRYTEDGDFHEVVIYPTPVELVGGAQDGALVEAGFSLDLEELRGAFDEITASGWNALGLANDSPCVYVEGTFQGRELYLRVLAHSPDDEEPRLKIDATRQPRKSD